MDTTENSETEVKVERLDDIPAIFAHLRVMKLQEAIDEAIDIHGNWSGLSPGWVITIWLVYILSEHNHFMDNLREWISKNEHIFSVLTGQLVRELDFTDDRLALCLRKLSDPVAWRKIEIIQGKDIFRVYDLDTEPVIRLDSTTAKVHHNSETHPTFQLGKSKNGSYEVQYKLMLASLDPLGLPLAIDVLPGNKADDPLYVPSYLRVKEILQKSEMLVIGDTKMNALETRATMVAGDDYYLTPLNKNDELLDSLLASWGGREDEMEKVFRSTQGATPEVDMSIAHGFECLRIQQCELDGETIEWEERLVVARSNEYKKSMIKGLNARLDKAEQELKKITPSAGRGKHQIRDEEILLKKIQKIENSHRVKGLFVYNYEKEVTERQVRRYKNRPARTETKFRFQLSVTRNQGAIIKVKERAGWRIYATNAPAEKLSLSKTVLAYRDQYIAENIFRRLKGEVLVISPLCIQRDDHAEGLFHLLTLAARVMALGDYLAKKALVEENTELAGLYPGNPKRSTATPTTERMLKAFSHINLIIIPVGEEFHYQVTPLTEVQLRILELWDFSPSIYTQFATNFAEEKDN